MMDSFSDLQTAPINTLISEPDDWSPLIDYVSKKKTASEVSVELIEALGDLKTHGDKLLKWYRLVNSPLPVSIHDKTESDVLRDSYNTDISTFNLMSESETTVKNSVMREYKFKGQLMSVPIFLDAAVLYFMRKATDEIVFYKLPMDMLELNMMAAVYKMPVALHNAFIKFVSPGYLRDIRIEDPPFLLTCGLTQAEIINQMPLVAEAMKEILNQLLIFKSTA
jgi:hypothetical protein